IGSTVTNATLVNNATGIWSDSIVCGGCAANVTVANTLLSNNGNLNLRKTGIATLTSGGHNLIDDGTASAFTVADPTNVIIPAGTALIAPLANYGGPTQTHALLPGSPGINTGGNAAVTNPPFSGPPFYDQRGAGFDRTVNGTVDIGAFESRGFSVAATSGTPQSAVILTAFGSPLMTTVTSGFSEPVSGGQVTFTAPASGASATFTGGVTAIKASINASGQATATATANGTAGGPYNVTATGVGITGTANFSLTNLKAATVTTVTSSVNPSNFGQSVTFTATVTSGAGTPTGTVQFKDGMTNLGGPVVLNVNGVATLTTSTLTVGTHPITADYGGDGNFAISTGTLAGGQVVNQPTLSINDVSTTEGQAGTKVLNFTVTLSVASNQTVTVNFATANGTATAGSDYVAIPSTLLTFNPGDTTKTIPVTINGDINFEPDETFTVNLSAPSNATISKASGTGTIQNDDAQGGFFSFSDTNYFVNEIFGFVTVTINRTNDVSQPANVDYATDDTGASIDCSALNTGLASQRCDYTSLFGTLKFAANETQKTIDIPINLDGYFEGTENFTVKLSNPTNGAVLTTPFNAVVSIFDAPAAALSLPNPIDGTDDFVRQQYHDFLNRDADPSGLAFWKNNIDKCNDPAQRPPGQTLAACIEVQRITTSAAFFLSIEFKQTGGLVRDFYVASLNRPLTNNMPDFVEFMRDTQAIQKGVVVGQGNWQQTLDANRLAFMNEFVMRPEFVGLYPTTDTPTQYVNMIYQHAALAPTPGDRAATIAEFGAAPTASDPAARARALLRITQDPAFQAREVLRAFVHMEYLGYLRRNPNDTPDNNFDGYNFWLNKLILFNGDFLQSEMVKAFLSSLEYRKRFGP
ncbi:MAG TPA: Calx-beta domain-containing protein, partial [Pyrinomonadaceae bacterium]|nr:Calx-beta domain-containing protein [Pyrinomonadaceae bacterium]